MSRLSRIVGLILLWLVAAVALVGADAGPRRPLLASQPPGWVKSNYSKFGTLPDLAFNFDQSLGWQRGQGQGNPSRFLTVSRASTAYEDDTSGNWYLFQANQLRQTNKGTLIEESRTNSIRNNSMQGAVAGTPGTAPTNWTIGVNGVTSTVVGTGTVSGIDYIDIRWNGTPGSTQAGAVSFEPATQISASNAQTWAHSVFLAIVGGSMSNISTIDLNIVQRNAGGANLGALTTNPSITSSLTRFLNIGTTNQATIAFVQPDIRLETTIGQAIDITIRIGWPQLELGASVTSPIRTTSAAVTRSADAISLTSRLNYGAAYTEFWAGTPTTPTSYGTNQIAVYINDGTANNRLLGQRVTSTGKAQFISTTGGTGTTGTSSAAWAQNAAGKVAVASANGDQSMSFNGASVVTGAGNFPVGVTTLNIGGNAAGGTSWNGYLTRVAVWASARIPDAALIAGTQ